MKKINLVSIISPISIIAVLFLIDMLIFGMDDNHVNFINMIIVITLLAIIQHLCINNLTKRVFEKYNQGNFKKTIQLGKRLLNIIFEKDGFTYSNTCLYVASSCLYEKKMNDFQIYINMVNHPLCLEAKFYWNCFKYFLNRDFNSLKEEYSSKTTIIDKDNSFYKMDVLFKGVILYLNNDLKQSKNTLMTLANSFNNVSVNEVYKEIIQDINLKLGGKQIQTDM